MCLHPLRIYHHNWKGFHKFLINFNHCKPFCLTRKKDFSQTKLHNINRISEHVLLNYEWSNKFYNQRTSLYYIKFPEYLKTIRKLNYNSSHTKSSFNYTCKCIYLSVRFRAGLLINRHEQAQNSLILACFCLLEMFMYVLFIFFCFWIRKKETFFVYTFDWKKLKTKQEHCIKRKKSSVIGWGKEWKNCGDGKYDKC